MARIAKNKQQDGRRGKLGKLVYSRNRYGEIVYELTEREDNPSEAQLRTRQKHQEVIKLWKTLNPKEIQQLNIYASDPDIRRACLPAKIVDGYSLFFHLKRNLQEIGETINKEVKSLESEIQYVYDFNIDYKKGRSKPSMKLYLSEDLSKETKLIIYATHPLPGGTGKPKKTWFRIIGVKDSSFKQGSNIINDYLKIFKEIDKEAMSIFFKFKTVDKRQGMCSNPTPSLYTLIIQ